MTNSSAKRRFGWLGRAFFVLGAVAILVWAWLSGALSPALMMASPAGRGHFVTDSILADLVVDIDGLAVEGLDKNLSGLTYAANTNTLFTVINNPPAVAEVSTDGALLRLIPIKGAKDTEGISHLHGNKFLIADERDQSIHLVHIDPHTEVLTLDGPPALKLDFGNFRNLGFEGASWDSRNNRLYLVQERLPIRLLVVDGLYPEDPDQERFLSVRSHRLPWLHRLALLDLSSLIRHEPSGKLLLLSDASKMLLEYDEDGQLVNVLRLRAGMHGLQSAIPQAEGVTMDNEGRLFIVSEPNLFYRFAHESTATEN
ncbi:SdiA-regulated domain-containing protein [Roseinatronobacter bogoriensis]|nr:MULTISPECIES: SdiA-regulated domain-containing protein [Rhodobaca]MBB4208619.1 uncharacterized protein YjiK [Rhodobaca bogoriensis DSM 18756]TDW38113.1 uncharacterized protein YjiK [Rhodobaca barguzinensis]TDY69717.1 uncharacterized protein YjiK [Rhodobaca bogoriensis DSM 18756]